MKDKIQEIFNNFNKNGEFSGVVSISSPEGVIFEQACGESNRAKGLLNQIDTAFAVASVTKLFTSLAICKLIENDKLQLQNKLWDVLSKYDLGLIHKDVTIKQLLTHTSGVGDYLDEDDDDYLENLDNLYKTFPPHLWDNMEYYLPMQINIPPKFEPGTDISYSNTGFVLLGLVIEVISGITYQSFVKNNIIKPLKLINTGFYRNDALPENAAYGYTENGSTNINQMPVIGGSDGGIFTCAKDLETLWRALFSYKILSKDMTENLLSPHAEIDDEESYGFGIYRYHFDGKLVYASMGCDTGVDCITAYFPGNGIVLSALGNTEMNTFPLLEDLVEILA